nr:hypothetical protein [uncultured Prevotella sp.]
MNKFLRYSFIALLALVCNVTFGQEVTLDFTNNTNWKFPDGSTKAQKEAADFTDGTYTVTVAAPKAYYWLSSNKALLMGKSGATLTLPKFNFEVERIDVIGSENGSTKTTRNIFVGDKAASTQTTSVNGTKKYEIAADYQAANTIYTIKVTNGNNDQIQKVLIWKKGTTQPEVTPTAANIAAFKALGVGKEAILTLTNAQVQYVGTNDMYIVDATGGIDIFKSDLKYTAGQVLNGTITATYNVFNKIPQLINITENKLTATDGIVTPIEMSVEDAALAENACKLVKITNVKAVKVGDYFYTDANKTIQIFDKFKLSYTVDTENECDYTGIIIQYNSQMELAPTVTPVTSNINDITIDDADANAPVYNLAGQKVSTSYKGVVIKAGKKFVQK